MSAGPAAVPLLIERLHGDPFVDTFHGNHSETMRILEKIGAPAVEPLVAAVREELARYGGGPAGSAEDDEDPFVPSALLVLDTLEDSRALPLFLEILEGHYPDEWTSYVVEAL